MEDTYTRHSTGYLCTVCGGEAIAEVQGTYLCADHAIEAMTVTIDLREPEPATEA